LLIRDKKTAINIEEKGTKRSIDCVFQHTVFGRAPDLKYRENRLTGELILKAFPACCTMVEIRPGRKFNFVIFEDSHVFSLGKLDL